MSQMDMVGYVAMRMREFLHSQPSTPVEPPTSAHKPLSLPSLMSDCTQLFANVAAVDEEVVMQETQVPLPGLERGVCWIHLTSCSLADHV